MVLDAIGIGVFNWLTLVTAAFAFALPSFWMSGAVASVVAIIGVVTFTDGAPDTVAISGWLVGQAIVALSVHTLFRRKS